MDSAFTESKRASATGHGAGLMIVDTSVEHGVNRSLRRSFYAWLGERCAARVKPHTLNGSAEGGHETPEAEPRFMLYETDEIDEFTPAAERSEKAGGN